MLRQPVPWRDWQRRRDYYSEGVMLWLAVDAELRARSAKQRSIDDCAGRFFAGASPEMPTRTYTLEDISRALNEVVPAEWEQFLLDWIDAHDELNTNSGLTRHGWRLVFTDTPTAAFLASEEEDGVTDLTYSIGLKTRPDGTMRSVSWNGPSFRAGMRPGPRIATVNGMPFGRDVILDAIRFSTSRRLVLTIEQDGHRSDVPIGYSGPLRYPRLQRIAAHLDALATLLAPR